MPSKGDLKRQSVFVNGPFDRTYERAFVALISALIALGRIPRCVLEVPETGQGRLQQVKALYRRLWRTVPKLKRNHGRQSLYSRAIFRELVEIAIRLASAMDLVED